MVKWISETNGRLFTRLLIEVVARIEVVLLPKSIVVALDCLLHFALLSFQYLTIYLRMREIDGVINEFKRGSV